MNTVPGSSVTTRSTVTSTKLKQNVKKTLARGINFGTANEREEADYCFPFHGSAAWVTLYKDREE